MTTSTTEQLIELECTDAECSAWLAGETQAVAEANLAAHVLQWHTAASLLGDRALDEDDLPSVPVCPLHGPSCEMWAAL